MQTRHWLIIPSVPIVIALGCLWYFTNDNQKLSMKLSSIAFEAGGVIPEKYTCDGSNVSPELKIMDVPSSAKSLVLFMEDPDIPEEVKKRLNTDVIYHWVRFNIPPATTVIPEATEPAGMPGSNTRDMRVYMGPCPPDREHRYFFKLYALDTMLDLPEGSNKLEVESAMQGHVLEKEELIGRYNRSQNLK